MSHEFPISATSWSLDHQGGTKSFHVLVLCHTASGRALFITRWGKCGTFGQVKVEEYATYRGAEDACDRKTAEKEKGGYRIDRASVKSNQDHYSQGSLSGHIGPQMTSTIAPNLWAWLRTGSKDVPKTEKELEAEKRYEDKLAAQAAAAERKAEAERLLQEQILREQEEERAKAQETIPNWGRF